MDDLEITRLCAEAMYDALEWEQRLFDYDPLHDDAQAMALLKKFKLRVYEPAEEYHWHTAIPAPMLGVLFPSYEKDLNRAICETVSEMEASK